MDKFSVLTAIAAPLNIDNIDTDKIIPARFLKTIKRTGLGKSAFADMRYNADGSERPDFVLNQAPYRRRKSWWRAIISAAAPRASTPPGR